MREGLEQMNKVSSINDAHSALTGAVPDGYSEAALELIAGVGRRP